jgi:hypothetical protein
MCINWAWQFLDLHAYFNETVCQLVLSIINTTVAVRIYKVQDTNAIKYLVLILYGDITLKNTAFLSMGFLSFLRNDLTTGWNPCQFYCDN